MSEFPKDGGPNNFAEMRRGLRRRKETLHQRNIQIKDLIHRNAALRIEVERLKGTTIKISDEGTGCCISCEAYAKELERVYRKLAANHVLELEAENTRWRETAKKVEEALNQIKMDCPVENDIEAACSTFNHRNHGIAKEALSLYEALKK